MKVLIDTNIIIDFLCRRDSFFDVADINKKTILKALDNEDFTDLEDSMQNECAVSSGVDYIVTRNGADFKSEKIPAVTPKEFIEIVRKRPRQ